MPQQSRQTALLAFGIFVLNVWLFWPLFLPGESPYRDTIEAGYQGMSRFLAENPSAWGWNPLQYCGQPTQFMYVPGLHYTSAILSWITTIPAPQAYKLITATMACLGPVALFFFIRTWTRSIWWALAAAFAFTFASPLYGLIPQLDKDRGIVYLPWRMHVFAKYGEGPHTAGLTLIAVSLIMAWKTATEHPRHWHVPVLASLFTLVCLTNWIAGLALAICMIVFLLSTVGLPALRRWRLIAAAVLAYGLASWWLTPTFISTIAFNWPADAFNYKLQATQNWLLAGWVSGLLLLRLLAHVLRWEFFPTFTWLGVWTFGYPVLIFYSYNVDTLPESRRYAVELSFFLFASITHFLWWAMRSGNDARQIAAAIVSVTLVVAAWPQARLLFTQPYERWMPVPAESSGEYHIARFIADQRPQGRVLASGGLRFRLNSWFDLQQVGGAFESGLRNRHPVHFAYQIRTGLGSRPDKETHESLLQMKALGVEYVVVHGPESDEHYRDYKSPMKFEGVLDKAWARGQDWVYRVPFTSLAHLIRPEEQPRQAHRDSIGKYVSAIDDTSRPKLEFRWITPRSFEVAGPFPDGYEVVTAVTWESGWSATQDGRPVDLGSNALNFVVTKPRPSERSVLRFEYRGTSEQRAMAVLSVFVWAGMLRFLWTRRRSSKPADQPQAHASAAVL